jgi:hypothetical protein
MDAAADGVLTALIVPGLIGLILWVRPGYPSPSFSYLTTTAVQLIFATLRPRFRQVYALREWFVQQECVINPFNLVLSQ